MIDDQVLNMLEEEKHSLYISEIAGTLGERIVTIVQAMNRLLEQNKAKKLASKNGYKHKYKATKKVKK